MYPYMVCAYTQSSIRICSYMYVHVHVHHRDTDVGVIIGVAFEAQLGTLWYKMSLFLPLPSMNLYELIKKNNFQGFSISLIRRIAYSLLQCLKILTRERIIHCDLKPVSH